MIVVCDTREQLSLWKYKCVRKKLEVGDYSSERLINTFAIERKSLQDLYGSITKGHIRFRSMFIRAQIYGIHCELFVEGTRKNFIAKKFPGGSQRKMEGTTLDKILSSIELRWGVKITWCGSRQNMKSLITTRLLKEERKLKKSL